MVLGGSARRTTEPSKISSGMRWENTEGSDDDQDVYYDAEVAGAGVTGGRTEVSGSGSGSEGRSRATRASVSTKRTNSSIKNNSNIRSSSSSRRATTADRTSPRNNDATSPATTASDNSLTPPAERRKSQHDSRRKSRRSSSSSKRPKPDADPVDSAASSTDPRATTDPPPPVPRYSVTELVKTLGDEKDTSELPPELERRVLDFRLAQLKRREKYGQGQGGSSGGGGKNCGIFGMYAHLSDVRIDLEWSEDAAWRRRNGMPYLSWQDFDATRNKGASNRPWFTYFVILLCTIMLIVEFGLNGWKVEPMTVNPMIGPSIEAMVDAGARDTQLIVEEGQWFRIFSPLFLHAGIIHYGINMLALWFIGGAIEKSHGIVNAMILFFVPGVGGNILSAIFLPSYKSVGASGGIFGLIGGCIADISLNWNLLFIKSGEDDTQTKRRNIVAITWLAVDIIVNMIIGFMPYIDNFSHMGGLVYGICCGLSAIERLPVGFFGVSTTTFHKIRSFLVRFMGLIVALILIVATTVILATMDLGTTFCSNCRYVSCVPFPPGQGAKWWYCDDCDQVTAMAFKPNGNNTAYDLIEMTCPDGSIEEVALTDETYTDIDPIRKQLPAYCRQYCGETIVN